jgi:hypothetical protein
MAAPPTPPTPVNPAVGVAASIRIEKEKESLAAAALAHNDKLVEAVLALPETSLAAAAAPVNAPSWQKSRDQYTVDTSDIVAIGILVLAIAAAFVAMVVALGFVFGKANGADTVKIVGTCVGGSTISGIVAALVGRKSKSRRKT